MLSSGLKVISVPVSLGSPLDGRLEIGGERVDARNAHAVQTAGNFVRVLVELAACVEDGKHHFEGRFAFLLVVVGGDATTVVLHGDGFVPIDVNVDIVAETGESLVDGVVNYLIYKVMETSFTGVADVHRGSFPHCFEAFEHLYAVGIVRFCGFLRRICYVFFHLFRQKCIFVSSNKDNVYLRKKQMFFAHFFHRFMHRFLKNFFFDFFIKK